MKTVRMPESVKEPFGLFAVIESKRIVLPLRGVESDFSVVSGIAEVSVTQIYRQENDRALDCEYLFPLPADASVYFCEADINGRTIRAQVREREEAQRLAKEKKAAGFRTALVEAERENLFTLSLGNVQPNDLVLIRLKYFQTLRALADSRSIEIPFCPGVRYIPGRCLLRGNRGKGTVDDTDQVPDASRITPVRIDDLHPDAAYIEVRGTLDGRFAQESDLCSPSHKIEVRRAGDELRIALSHKGEVPNRDFVLRWKEQPGESLCSRSWVTGKGDENYALIEIRAPKSPVKQRAPVDFYFLVDRSGSMQGEKWTKAVEALQSCVGVLQQEDRAMVTFFETNFRDFAEKPMPVRQLAAFPEFQSIQQLGAAGGTEMGPALEHVLKVAQKHSAGRDKNLILITDAEVGNENHILEIMGSVPDLPVHCFGIDVALNDSLLLALARQQGGSFHSLHPNDDIRQELTALGKTLGQPVLLDLRLSEGWELADAKIPNLYAGQVHYLSARAKSGNPPELAARSPNSGPVRIQFERQQADVQAAYLHWCRSRIQRWIAEGQDRKAVDLSVQSNLICPLTAFIAWDESEKVAVASHGLVQPCLEPAGDVLYSLCKIVPQSAPTLGCYDRLMTGGRGLCSDSGPQAREGVAPELRTYFELRRELADLCHLAAVPGWEPLVEEIMASLWAEDDSERGRRHEEVRKMIDTIKKLAERITALEAAKDKVRADETRQEMLQLLKSTLKSPFRD